MPGGIAALVVVAGAAVALTASAAAGRTSSEQPSSILIFPKVIANGTRDTFIQISNTANSMVHAHCFYVNAFPVCQGEGDCLEGTCTGVCERQWQEIDFNISLTKQQPTHWSAFFGRLGDVGATQDKCEFDTFSQRREYDCYNAGLSFTRIPPVFPFEGELRCIEVDQSGAPISGNHLKGEATIVGRDGDASKYNAIGLLGEPFTNNGDNTLCLGGPPSLECPTGAEYEGCPERYWIPHFAIGADNPIFGATSQVRTDFTVVPCRANYELGRPTRVTLQFRVFNEFEQPFSAAAQVECWDRLHLDDVNEVVFGVNQLGSRLVNTSVRPVVPFGLEDASSIALVVEEHHELTNGAMARAAYNAHEIGTYGLDEATGEPLVNELIVIPAGP